MRAVRIDRAAWERAADDPRWARIWSQVLDHAAQRMTGEEGEPDTQRPAVIEAAGRRALASASEIGIEGSA